MKTGKVAKLLGIDPKTVTYWITLYSEFFTDSAQGVGRTQREFAAEDLIVLNTIRAMRSENADPEEIQARLSSGERAPGLPAEAVTMDTERAVAVYAQMRVMENQIEALKRERDALATSNEEKQRIIDEKQREIEKLNRELGKWEGRYEELQQRRDQD